MGKTIQKARSEVSSAILTRGSRNLSVHGAVGDRAAEHATRAPQRFALPGCDPVGMHVKLLRHLGDRDLVRQRLEPDSGLESPRVVDSRSAHR